MRLILEHPWLTFIVVGSIGFGFLWFGLRENLVTRCKIGLSTISVSIVFVLLGIYIETPREAARRVVTGFTEAVVDQNIPLALSFTSNDIEIVDEWKGKTYNGHDGIITCLEFIYEKHKLTFNTVLRMGIIERERDVLVELSLFTRVTGIGSVPSRWWILLREDPDRGWKINSVDAVEIAGRSFR
mgnify:CR=1 FL=1